MTWRALLPFLGLVVLSWGGTAQDYGWTGTNSLALPAPGDHLLRILTPNYLELTLITTRKDVRSPLSGWDFVGENFVPRLPAINEFDVRVNGKPMAVEKIGFKRRPLYAPLKHRDLRIGSWLYLVLSGSIPEGAQVRVLNPGQNLWTEPMRFESRREPFRFNPAIHVNQVGFEPTHPKKGAIGYYLGSLGELPVEADGGFELIDTTTGNVAFSGKLRRRPDRGFTYTPPPYQAVFEADFSNFTRSGTYRLVVPGMGGSLPFQIQEGIMGAFARTYALGMYHQRCGTSNALPFTRHQHAPCHTAPAEIPAAALKRAAEIVAEVAADAKKDPRHVAPQVNNFETSLYPFIKTGKVDVSGGHHDAGDYSKYTINSAGLIHHLVFAADNFGAAGDLDNLGIPESGDGKSDLLQEAKWEADYLAKMQDSDGGFFFLVYPKTRRYEDNVLPEKGDPQIVWPKNTAATAAAVAALAEAGSSPRMKKQFPQAADEYLRKAQRGWAFLERALAKHGKDGAYQKLTHYGHEFLHDDELAWAVAALFAATSDKRFEAQLKRSFDPESRETRRWSWWPMFEAYGCATRTYVFAPRNGRLKLAQVDAAYLTRCETLIHETAQNQVRFAAETAYGTSFPEPNKANRNAGWYFSSERAFDITVAYQLRGEPALLDAVLSNLSFEAGCNPVNVSYLGGLGARRQREIVHQFAQNDLRPLPPSGLPFGNIQAGFAFLHHYGKELGELCFPPDGANNAPYPMYDRWGDSFNTTTEFVVTDIARSLASLSFWMAETSLKTQKWSAAKARITGVAQSVPADQVITARLEVDALDLREAEVLWEGSAQEPVLAPEWRFRPGTVGDHWVEAEGRWPDGRRVFASARFQSSAPASVPPNSSRSAPAAASGDVLGLFHLDGSTADAARFLGELRLEGKPQFDPGNVSWMRQRSGSALRFHDLGDRAVLGIPAKALGNLDRLVLEAMVYVNSFRAYNRTNTRILSFSEDWNAALELGENMYEGPLIRSGTQTLLKGAALTNLITPGRWHHLEFDLNSSHVVARLNGQVIARQATTELQNWGKHQVINLELGNFDGWVDEVIIRGKRSLSAPASAIGTVEGRPARPVVRALSSRVKGQVEFLGIDPTTRGNWIDKYGARSHILPAGEEKKSEAISAEFTGAEMHTWAEKPGDNRAPLKAPEERGPAACWFNPEQFNLRLNLPEGQKRKVSLYFLDWDGLGRVQKIEVLHPGTGELLDARQLSNFQEGVYLRWSCSGPIEFRFSHLEGRNVTLSGVFVD